MSMAEADTDKKNNFILDIDNAIREFKESSPETKDSKKNDLFQKLFKLMTFECGLIWADVLKSHHYTQKFDEESPGTDIRTVPIESALERLNRIFYSKSKWIKKDGSKYFDYKKDPIKELARLVKESYRIELIPSKLFLEFLLFVATKIRDEPLRTNTPQLVCLGTLARKSDQESVLNIAQENNRFFMITTEPTTRATFEQILAIYTACRVRFTGNISISHIIGQLCEGITGTGMQTESAVPVKPLEVRTEMEQMMLNRYSLTKADVQKSPPVKGGITKPAITKPAITKPAMTTPASSSIKARPDAPLKRPAAVQVKPICPHGVKCYRRHNRQHENEYSHPEVKPTWKGGGSGKSKRTRRRTLSSKRTKRHRPSTRRPSTKRSSKRR